MIYLEAEQPIEPTALNNKATKAIGFSLLPLGVLVGALYWIYGTDGELMVNPELQRRIEAIPRSEEGARNVAWLLGLQYAGLSRNEEHATVLSDLALERTLTDEEFGQLSLAMAEDEAVFTEIRRFLATDSPLRFPEYVKYDFGAESKMDGALMAPELFVRHSALARNDGRLDEALQLALEGLKLSSDLACGGGVFIHLLLAGEARYRCLVAIERVFAQAKDKSIQRKILEELGKKEYSLPIESMKEVLIAEHKWSLTVKDKAEPDYEKLREYGMLPEPDSFIWNYPKVFGKTNQTLNLYGRITIEIIGNLDVPESDQQFDVADELDVFAQDFNPFDPNAIGKLNAAQSYNLFSHVCGKQRSCNLFAEALRLGAALRLYELQCEQLPESIEKLIPEFIDSIPVDFADGADIRYSADERIVYSIGYDLYDDEGLGSSLPFDYADASDLVLRIPNPTIIEN